MRVQSPVEMMLQSNMSESTDAKVLQVAQIFGQELVDVKCFAPSSGAITCGNQTGKRFRFAGQPVAWVPRSFASMGWMMYPFTEITEEWRSDFFAPSEEEQQLFIWKDEKLYCNLKPTWQGFVESNGVVYSLRDLLPQNIKDGLEDSFMLQLHEGSRLVLEIGGLTYVAQFVDESQMIYSGLGEEVDYPFWAVFLAVASVIGGMGAYLQGSDPPSLYIEESRSLSVSMLLQPAPPEVIEEATEAVKSNKDKKELSKRKNPSKKRSKGKAKRLRSNDSSGPSRGAGIRRPSSDKQMAQDLASGLNFQHTDGGEELLDGMRTVGSKVAMNSNMPGSGTLQSQSGLDRVSTGGQLGDGVDAGNCKRCTNDYTASPPQSRRQRARIKRQTPRVLGSMDRSLVSKVIRRNLSQIRYCYQRQLSRNPSLSGKITVRFIIGKDGRVSSSKVSKSSMNSSAVENCVAGRFKRFQFAKPKGNGIVIVTYPFVFNPQ